MIFIELLICTEIKKKKKPAFHYSALLWQITFLLFIPLKRKMKQIRKFDIHYNNLQVEFLRGNGFIKYIALYIGQSIPVWLRVYHWSYCSSRV